MFMRRFIAFLVFVMPLILSAMTLEYDEFFEDETLNVELIHSGRYGMEFYRIENMYGAGRWAGSKTRLIDATNYGVHRVEVYSDKKLIYSRNYCSLFEEWSTTAAGKRDCRAFEEVVRVPMPKEIITLRISSKNERGVWKEVFADKIDPLRIGSPSLDRVCRPFPLSYAGDINKKLDVVILPAGYSIEDSAKLRRDIKMFGEFMFSKPPFDGLRDRINVWGVEYFSEYSGIPGLKGSGLESETELGLSYNTFGSPRYLMSENLFNIHSLLRDTPYDQIVIMCNSNVYGGGGIYNFYATSYVNPNNSFVLIHEFGHSFAALGDEYSDNDSDLEGAYKNVEPWQPNITALKDFSKKWKDMVGKKVPIPTPCTPEYEDVVGVYEGAAYSAKGLYRPYQDCLMRSDKPFCPVCVREILNMMELYTE